LGSLGILGSKPLARRGIELSEDELLIEDVELEDDEDRELSLLVRLLRTLPV